MSTGTISQTSMPTDLDGLVSMAQDALMFLKGQDVDVELTEATKCWNVSFCKHPSRTQENGCILEIHEAELVSERNTASD